MNVFPSVYRSITSSLGTRASSATHSTAILPPSTITDYWRYGSTMLKSGDIPIASAGDALTKWVGTKLGTVLTATSITTQSVNGLLTAKNNAGGNFQLPGAFATARTDFSIFLHIQRPECYQTRAYCGFGATRQLDITNFGTIANLVSNGAANTTYESTGRASTFTLSLRSNGSNLRLGINGVEINKTALTAASMTGGRLLSLFDGSVMSSDRIWAAAIGPYLNDADFNQTIAWCQSVRPIPSETAPTYNIVVFGDSQTSGLNAGGHSWMLDMVDAYDARVIPIVGSATYFAAGATPQSRSQNLTQLDLELRPSADRNIIIVGTSNDLDQGTGAGQAYADAIVTKLGSRLGDWEVYVAKQPVRAAPYVPVASFNTERAAFNSAIVSDGWTGLIDWSDLTTDTDGIHWPSSQQTVAFNRVVSALGLV